VDYAKQYGIDIDALWMEHPSHPDQLKFAKRWRKKADVYWLMNMLAQRSEPTGVQNKRRNMSPKTPRKKYVAQTEFEDWQLQIAINSLMRQAKSND